MYHIEEVKGWDYVGYLEDSTGVPTKPELPDKYLNAPLWLLFGARVPANRLFDVLRIPLRYRDDQPENLLDFWTLQTTKYIRIQYQGRERPIYGWVDGVALVNKAVAIVAWHPDIMRNCAGRYKIKGVVSRRLPSDEDPYYPIPYKTTTVGLESIPMNDQIRGVYWVILSYCPPDSMLSKLTNSAIACIPNKGAQIITSFVSGFIQGPTSLIQTAASELFDPLDADATLSTKGTTSDWFTYHSCITFPVSADATRHLYFQGVESKSVAMAPTFAMVGNGIFAARLGISASQLTSCYVSPVCPLGLVGAGSGLHMSDPIILNRGITKRTFKLSEDGSWPPVFIKKCRIVNNNMLIETPYGLHNVGDIRYGGDSRLRQFLETYDLGIGEIPPFVSDDGKYEVRIHPTAIESVIQSDEKEEDVTKCKLIRLSTFLNRIAPGWKNNIAFLNRVPLVMRSVKTKNYFSRVYRVVPKVVGTSYTLPGWQRSKHVDGDKTIYEWDYKNDPEDNAMYVDVCTNDEGRTKYRKATTDFERNQVIPKVLCGIDFTTSTYTIILLAEQNEIGILTETEYCTFRSLHIVVDSNSSTLTMPMKIEGMNPDGMGLYSLNSSWSLTKDWKGYNYITSELSSWPTKYVTLDRQLYSDENRDLILLGPNGNIVYRFPRGYILKEYSMQTVLGNNTAYLRVSFNPNQPRANNHEVDIPLTSCNISTGYVDPMRNANELTQTYYKQYIEDQLLSAERSAEDETRKAARNAETHTYSSNFAELTKQQLNSAAETLRGVLQNAETTQKTVSALGTAIKFSANIAAGFNKVINKGSSFLGLGNLMPESATDPNQVFGDLSSLLETSKKAVVSANDYLQSALDNTQGKAVFTTLEEKYAREDADIERVRSVQDLGREKLRKLAVFNVPPEPPVLVISSDMSWTSRYGCIEFAYQYKDSYSMYEYWENISSTGIETGEYRDSDVIQKLIDEGGPICVTKSEIVPKNEEERDTLTRTEVTYLKERFANGIYFNPAL